MKHYHTHSIGQAESAEACVPFITIIDHVTWSAITRIRKNQSIRDHQTVGNTGSVF
jgi:hypothetical protein